MWAFEVLIASRMNMNDIKISPFMALEILKSG